MPIRAVIFDLGNTLVYFDGRWPQVVSQAERELAQALTENNFLLDAETVEMLFSQRMSAYRKAREVIEALLEKYADEGIENIESLEVLRVEPFNKIGTPTEIVKLFGSRDAYLDVIGELEREIYAAV